MSNYIHWILDASLVCIFLGTVAVYAVRGFVRSVWGFVSAAVAFAASWYFAPYASNLLYNLFLSGSTEKPEVALLLSKIMSYIVAYFIALIIMRLLGIVVNRIASAPVISGINRIFGGVLGAGVGAIYVWVICWIISFAVEKHLAGDVTEAVRLIAENSVIFRFFCDISPLDYINIKPIISKIDGVIHK